MLGNSLTDVQYKLYALFYLVVLPALVMPQTQPMFAHNVSEWPGEASLCPLLPLSADSRRAAGS